MRTSADLLPLSPALSAEADAAWQRLWEAAGPDQQPELAALLAHEEAGPQLRRLLACSPYAAAQWCRRPGVLVELWHSGSLNCCLDEQALAQQLRAALAEEGAALEPVLRRFRQWHMLRILWRDFNRLADTLQTVRDTSLLAEVCIAQALEHCRAPLVARFGEPMGRHSGEAQQLIVLAMGKLGARELNVSSDIDLIFAYPEGGSTNGSGRTLSNEEFFTRLGRALINALDTITADGFVFRVDMRLRPYGESGALAHSFAALEAYYQEQGRDWERYALIKARPVTGEPHRHAELMAMLRPFVFRRYVDFSVIDSLRGMKQMISAEVARRGLQQNVKLGRGGIREVEFIAQCLQLIRGGRDLALQQRELLPVLSACAELGCLPVSAVLELRAAYLFLRDSEHAIQGYADRQTQELPEEPLPRAALAAVMCCADWDAYQAQLNAHRARVIAHFDALIQPPEAPAPAVAEVAHPAWQSLDAAGLSALGYTDAPAALSQLADLQQSPVVLALQSPGRERLQQFMPLLLAACADVAEPDLALARIVPLVRAVLRRSAYLVLLTENPLALAELVALCEASPWIADLLATHPVLLDELLDRASLYTAPDRERLREELAQQVERLPLDDLEAQMEALRYFKAAHVLRVAASERLGRLPLMKVSDKLTFIAEVALEQVLRVARALLVARHGEPSGVSEGGGFAICAYGKLGGIELGYGSDLDLVFIYDADAQGATSGSRSIDNTVFFTRLGQKIIHILETRTALGQLYEVDMRLRPSGNSGMLVSSLKAFAQYQRESAWTWEHQALVRARTVAGDRQLQAAIEAERCAVLRQPRAETDLAREVLAMREKMRAHLLPNDLDEGVFHLKQSAGGIVDIEFMVQYAVLAYASRAPQLARWSDNIRILEELGHGIVHPAFSPATCAALIEAYIALRSAAHRLALQQAPSVVPITAVAVHAGVVRAQWQQLFSAFMETEQ